MPARCRPRCRAKARKYGTFRLPDNQNNTKKEKEVKEIRYVRQDALKGLLKPVAGTSLPDIPAWLFLRKEEAMEKIRAFEPEFCETLPLSLEEVFILEMEEQGYAK